MNINTLFTRLKNFLISKLISPCISQIRILEYKILSTWNNVKGQQVYVCAVLIKGLGEVIFHKNVAIVVLASPYFYNTYCYVESRFPTSIITFGSNVIINNNACLVSEGKGIFIGSKTLIGANFTAFDSDFHELNPFIRLRGTRKMGKVKIEENVFIGSNVTILKGTCVGKNSVIASSSVVSNPSLPTLLQEEILVRF